MIPVYGHGRPAALPVRCPLCRIHDGTHDIKGTDRRVCTECLGGIPYDLHNPPPQVLPVTT